MSNNGIESIETNLKEYIRINRQHILTKRDDEIQNIHKSFNTKKLLKVQFYDGMLDAIQDEINQIEEDIQEECGWLDKEKDATERDKI